MSEGANERMSDEQMSEFPALTISALFILGSVLYNVHKCTLPGDSNYFQLQSIAEISLQNILQGNID